MSPGSNPASETSCILNVHAAEFAGKVLVYTNFKYSWKPSVQIGSKKEKKWRDER
jgi:hypothetical protein